MTDKAWSLPVPLDGDTSTEAEVFRTLNAVFDNGYDNRCLTPMQIAEDLVMFHPGFDRFAPEALEVFAENWLLGG